MTNDETKPEVRRQKPKQEGKGGWWFLAAVLLVYVIVALRDSNLILKAMAFFSILIAKVAPVLLLVFGLIFLFNYFFNPQIVKSYLGSKAGLKGWVLAIVGGILSMGPVSAWYAVIRELRQHGMTSSLAAAFLYSRAVKLPMLPLLVYYFGLQYTAVLCVYLIGFSVVSGLIMGRIGADQ